jgi:hypothetical protein
MTPQCWIIDTDTPGMSEGEFSASGPYPTQRSAEQHILRKMKELFGSSCSCIQSDKTSTWCKPLHIVKVVRTVQPAIRARVTLEDT